MPAVAQHPSTAGRFLSDYPELVAQFDTTRNGDIDPTTIAAGSDKRYWWNCATGTDHSWEAPVKSRTSSRARGCGFCSGQRLSADNSLAARFPDIAVEFDTAKNGIGPGEVLAGTNKKYWWKCAKGDDHSWEAAVNNRTSHNHGCGFCSGQRLSADNSLAARFPDIAVEFDTAKNGIGPGEVLAGTNKKYWWKCAKGDDHSWEAVVSSRTSGNRGCGFCSGRRLSADNSLATRFPDVAAEFDTAKNGIGPGEVLAGTHQQYWWKCAKGTDHSWEASVDGRTSDNLGCGFCAGKRLSVTNNLAACFPEIAAEFDVTKNGISPSEVLAGTSKKYWWKCGKGAGHAWEAAVNSRTSGNLGCGFCAGQRLSADNSLAARFPDIAAEFDIAKNGIGPREVLAGTHQQYWWKCPKGADHSWEAAVNNRTSHNHGCSFCSGKRLSVTNSLTARFPDISVEFNVAKNGIHPSKVLAGTSKKYWWKCAKGDDHSWEAAVSSRTSRNDSGCPRCNRGWTRAAVRGFLEGLLPYMGGLSQPELYAVCERVGLFGSAANDLAVRLCSGSLSLAELRQIVDGEKAAPGVDDDPASSDEPGDGLPGELDAITQGSAPNVVEGVDSLPRLSVDEILAPSSFLLASADGEQVEYLIAARVAVLWAAAYADEHVVDAEAFEQRVDEHQEEVRSAFRAEFDAARALPLPARWAFRPEETGGVVEPLLMQRHVAVQVRDRRRVGNWSAAGAGKTVSAVLAARTIESELTVVVCPNNTVDGWVKTIMSCDPDARVSTRRVNAVWADKVGPRWLVLNYERLQQPTAEAELAALVAKERIEFVVVDEVHFVKSRSADAESIRRGNLQALLVEAARKTDNLAVLGMSATPVVNDLFEARSLLELVEGVDLSDLRTEPTIQNAMKIHQRLVRTGARWKPTYSVSLQDEEFVPVDCADWLDDIRALRKPHPAAVEQALIDAKLPAIVEACLRGGKTLVYTEFLDGVRDKLVSALEGVGLRVGTFTGKENAAQKTAVLDAFLGKVAAHDELDVLIGSSAIGTGVDGLQRVCSRVVFATLPWTHAAYEQIIGRLYRQGSTSATVERIIPITSADVAGADKPWSWCTMRWDRIVSKRTLADVAVDGVFPEETNEITPAQATRETLAWLARIDAGNLVTVDRKPLTGHLDPTPLAVARRRHQFGDFSVMNARWNATRSDRTHERLAADPDEWWQYHDLYREASQSWEVVPAARFARWALDREAGRTIADLGCGEMLLADLIGDRHRVLGFDHVAVDERVTVADIRAVPLPDASVNIVVLSLALMGSNHDEYLAEARRLLPVDSQLWVAETQRHLGTDEDRIRGAFADRGFGVHQMDFVGQFTLVRAARSENDPVAAPRRLFVQVEVEQNTAA